MSLREKEEEDIEMKLSKEYLDRNLNGIFATSIFGLIDPGINVRAGTVGGLNALPEMMHCWK